MNSDRVIIRTGDAVHACNALRFDIERTDELLAKYSDDKEFCDSIAADRENRWQAYQRIAKALGLKPTLSTPEVKHD